MKSNYKSLSYKYHKQNNKNLSKEEVEAYLIGRMPATYAALLYVFEKCKNSFIGIKSFLDLGAGPGSGLLALKEHLSHEFASTLVEKNKEMISQGKKRFAQEEITWVEEDFIHYKPSFHDLALFSYSLNEIPFPLRLGIIEKIWEKVAFLVIIEPGTPQGFSDILAYRSHVLAKGAHIIAPCPHSKLCPMLAKEKWCHFSTRLQRSKEHCQIKGATLGWEDEKFCYLAVSKEKIAPPSKRVVDHPKTYPGYVTASFCTKEGELFQQTFTKKDKDLYKIARKLKWGDSLE